MVLYCPQNSVKSDMLEEGKVLGWRVNLGIVVKIHQRHQPQSFYPSN